MLIPALLVLAALATATPADPSSWAPSLRTCFSATGALDETCWAARIASLRTFVVHDHFETAIRQLQVFGDGDGDGEAGDPADGEDGDPADGEDGDPADGEAGDPADGPPAPVPATPRRHKAGMKCAGASGFPAVEYLGCEDGYECTGAAQDWGKICVSSVTPTSTPPPTPAPAPAPASPALGPCPRSRGFNRGIQEDARYYCQCGRTCRYWERNGGQAVC